VYWTLEVWGGVRGDSARGKEKLGSWGQPGQPQQQRQQWQPTAPLGTVLLGMGCVLRPGCALGCSACCGAQLGRCNHQSLGCKLAIQPSHSSSSSWGIAGNEVCWSAHVDAKCCPVLPYPVLLAHMPTRGGAGMAPGNSWDL
jgi:hypothetical protein